MFSPPQRVADGNIEEVVFVGVIVVVVLAGAKVVDVLK
jgi:hypothetical protein